MEYRKNIGPDWQRCKEILESMRETASNISEYCKIMIKKDIGLLSSEYEDMEMSLRFLNQLYAWLETERLAPYRRNPEKFEIGDEVRANFPYPSPPIEGVIIYIDEEEKPIRYEVEWEDERGIDREWFTKDELEKINPKR